MRSDMPKVITECYRHGRGNSYKIHRNSKRNADIENAPQKESMRKWAKSRDIEKDFGEHLGPLRRFIASKVGHKWDDVFSEICKSLNVNSQTHNHIIQHMYDTLEKDTFLGEDGHPYVLSYNGPRRADIETRWWNQQDRFYVCPETGIIKKVKYIPRTEKEYPPFYKIVADDSVLIQIKNIWYMVSVHPDIDRKELERLCSNAANPESLCTSVGIFAPTEKDFLYYNYIYKKIVRGLALTSYEKAFFYRYSKMSQNVQEKRQISKRDLKKYGLK